MNRRRSLFLLVLTTLLTLGGVAWLLSVLFSTGDTYPPYSTLRSDPLGSRALYDSLQSMDGLKVRRNFQAPALQPEDPPQTLAFLGANPEAWRTLSRERADFLIEATRNGYTVVIAFVPGEYSHDLESLARYLGSTQSHTGNFSDRFGLEIRIADTSAGPQVAERVSPPAGSAARLPQHLPTQTNLRLKPTVPGSWRVLYRDPGGGLLAERVLGRGRLIVLADSFTMSNEALAHHLSPELITYLLGDHPVITFDESHLGLMENPGVGTLLARYGLFPFLGGLAIAGLLLVWRVTVPLLPPVADRGKAKGRSGAVEGRTSSEGFLSLLQRGIAPRELIPACWESWKRTVLSNPHLANRYRETIDEAEDLLRVKENLNHPLTTFQTLNRKFQNYKEPS